jgi:flagellin-like hook-associated protein FlgL
MSHDVHLLDWKRHDAWETAQQTQEALSGLGDMLSDIHDLLVRSRDQLRTNNGPDGENIAREIDKILPDIATVWARF